MKEMTIVADDKVGLLADISYILSKAKINVESIHVDVVSGKSIITLGLSDSNKGREVLENAGFKIEETDALVIKLDDKPGELNRITTMLSKEGISINNVHVISKDGKNTVLSILVNQPKKASNMLKNNLITREE